MLDDDRAVLLHLPSARRVVLTQTATRAWQLLLEHGRLADVLTVLEEEFAADPAVIEADVQRLVTELVEQDLLQRDGPDE